MQTQRLNEQDCNLALEGSRILTKTFSTVSDGKTRVIEEQRREIERLTQAVTLEREHTRMWRESSLRQAATIGQLQEAHVKDVRRIRHFAEENTKLYRDLLHTSEVANAHQRALESVLNTYIPYESRNFARAYITGFLGNLALEGGPFDDIRERNQHTTGGAPSSNRTQRSLGDGPERERAVQGGVEVLRESGKLPGRDPDAE